MRVQCTGTLYVSVIPCVLAELCMSFVIEHAFCFIRKLYLVLVSMHLALCFLTPQPFLSPSLHEVSNCVCYLEYVRSIAKL